MKLKQKIISYFSLIFVIGVIVFAIYKQKADYVIPLENKPNYFQDMRSNFENNIKTNYPQLIVNIYLPYKNENNYFNYAIYPSFTSISKIDIYLTAKNPTDLNLDTQYAETKNEILNWIVTKGTLISDIQIDWYASLPETNQKTLIEQTNA